MLIVIGIDTSCSEDSNVNTLQVANIGQVQCSDNIASNRLLLVVLAPIDVGASSAASTVKNMSWLDFFNFCNDRFPILHANSGGVNFLSLAFEKSLEMSWGNWVSTVQKLLKGGGGVFDIPATQPSPPQIKKRFDDDMFEIA